MMAHALIPALRWKQMDLCEFQDSQHCIERPVSPLFPERDRESYKERRNKCWQSRQGFSLK